MEFLSVNEVAKILKVSVSTVRLNAKKDAFGFRCIKAGSQWRFPKEDVLKYAYGDKWKEMQNEDGTIA